MTKKSGEGEKDRQMRGDRKKIKKYIPLFLSLIIPGFGQLTQRHWAKSLFFFSSPLLLFSIFMLLLITTGFFYSPGLLIYYFLHVLIIFILIYVYQLIDIYKNIIGRKNNRLQGTKQIKKNLLPLILSLFIPGLGQLAKAQIIKGLLIIGAPLILVSIYLLFYKFHEAIDISLLFMPLSWALSLTLYIWQLIDAYYS